jgi:aspartate-semialdehyde dehydrogenase
VTDPADGARLGEVDCLSGTERAAAVDGASAAFAGWAALLPQERSRLLRRWFELMTVHRDDLARIMSAEQG